MKKKVFILKHGMLGQIILPQPCCNTVKYIVKGRGWGAPITTRTDCNSQVVMSEYKNC